MSKVQPDQMPDYPEQALQRFNPFEAELKQAAADYSNLTISGAEDASGYDAVRNAIARFTGLRTGIEKTRTEIKAPALLFGRRVDAEAKRLTDLIAGAESKLRKEKARIDEIREDERRAAERAEMERYKQRTDQLFAVGFVYDGSDYIAGNIAVWADGLLKLTDEQFVELLENGRKEIEIEKASKQAYAEQLVREAEQAYARKSEQAAKEAATARQTVQDQRSPETTQPPIEVKAGAPGLTEVEPDAFFRPVAIVSAPEHPNPYITGFHTAINAVLQILDTPEKFTRAELRAKIQHLKP